MCQYKGCLKLGGQEGEKSDFERMTSEEESEVRIRGLEYLLSCHPAGETCQGATLTADDLAQGTSVFLDAKVDTEVVSLRYDGLVRVEGVSRLGNFHYVPVICQAGLKIRRQTRDLLAFLGMVLEAIQGRQPATGIVICGPACRRTRIKVTEKLNRRARDTLEALKQLQSGGKTPILTLNEHCQICEFRRRCHAQAVRQDDLSLLQVMGMAELRRQRRKGIFTVTQLSYTFRPRRKGKRIKGEGQPHHAALQALAIRDGKTYVFARPEVPDCPTRVYLDLEGDASAASIYLLGALVVRGGVGRMHSFWADIPSDENRFLSQLLKVVDGEDFVLFHFGSYEKAFLKRMGRVAKQKGPINRLLSKSVDILSLIRSNVYFPVYANGLKEIGKHLGCGWSDQEASGLQSLVWRRRWEETRDDAFKQRLVSYNADDCAALRRLTEHLDAIAMHWGREDGSAEAVGLGQIEQVTAGKRGTDFPKWGHTAFLLPEFERVSKCAWFDYQREKIVARKQSRRTATPLTKKVRQPRPNKRIEVRSNRCPGCMSRNVCKSKSPRRTKLVFDLKMSEGAIRRVVLQYVAAKYRCRDCLRYFLPKKFKKLRRFRHTLQCWTLYQHVANRTSFQSLERTFKECLGLTISFNDLHRFKIELARRYKWTYVRLLKKIVAGNLVQVDETGVRFKHDRGYVWAFTNLENVVFMCRPTRETDFLKSLLNGFAGVLVSDFYTGYDSLPCPQQKCLVHLIRDLNGDLLANFHDEEFKGLAKTFGALLVKIVESIDRYGLQRRHLHGHKTDVQEFFREACERPCQSELAEKYRKRFLRYQDKLFVFLDHDGVPWNNNNAEHAIKHFAKYRIISNGRMTASGLQAYLILLSIYQTCEYKRVSFLRFLLSKERAVDAFTDSGRSHLDA
jgi:predicted RecB family nuclease